MDTSALRALRREMQVIFQDPVSSLNPRMTIGAIIREGLTIHKLAEGAAADARVRQLLQEVGLSRWSRSSSSATSRCRPSTSLCRRR
jgi:ABC-type microcin C transport system duplicated ATPase subunit YejF